LWIKIHPSSVHDDEIVVIEEKKRRRPTIDTQSDQKERIRNFPALPKDNFMPIRAKWDACLERTARVQPR
jgi:hypothetical protein